jgi:hypothetical protein
MGRETRIWRVIPSWMISLALHSMALALLLYSYRPPTHIGSPDGTDTIFSVEFGNGDGSGRGDPGGGPGEFETSDPADAAPASGGREIAEADRATSSLTFDETPPVDLELPVLSAASIGKQTGWVAPSFAGDARQMIGSIGAGLGEGGTGTGGGAGTGGGSGGGTGRGRGRGTGGGGTTFFGQQAHGSRFVYLVDSSGSMYDHNAIARAKAELRNSLEQLDPTQQFQIIFYNDQTIPMKGIEGKSQMFWGTDVNRTLASQFIRSIQPDGGTRHLDALLLALSYGPEVLFFLTDAGEPILYAKDLDTIKRRNNGRTQIHTIEFGKLANLNLETNFLKKLARDNGGGYVYRDITKFEKE